MITKLTTWTFVALGICVLVLTVLFVVRWLRQVQFTRLLARLDHLEKKLSPDMGNDSVHARDAASLIARTRFIAAQAKKAPDHKFPADLVNELHHDLDLFYQGCDVFADKRGPILKAYLSDIDGTIQTYSVNVPANYLGDHPIPLLVHLHGHGWFEPFQEHPAPEYSGAIVLAPHGRGATDYLYIGELDVLKAIAEVKRDYLIDDSRVYLSGSSMGGTGCWTIAAHHPDLFAGIAPRAGNADYHAWESRWNWNTSESSLQLPLHWSLRNLDNPLTYARNLAPVPIYCLHNAGDEVVPVEHARAMVQAVREAGADCRYLEFLSGDHATFDKTIVAEQIAWVASHQRTTLRKVAFTTARLRQGRVAWVRVDGFIKPLKLANIEAQLLSDTSISVTCDNVSAFTLTPPDLRAPVDITVNGTGPIRVSPSTHGSFRLHLTAGLWSAGPLDEATPRKRLGLEGPVDEVFLTPFLLVHPTQGNDPEGLRAVEAEVDRFAWNWSQRYGFRPRECLDTQVTDDDQSRYNLVLFGRPDQNALLKRFADHLPLKFTKDSIEALGARYSGDDVGTIFCYPNPEIPGRMLVVYAALADRGYYQIDTRFDKWFNWGIFDCRKWFDYAVFDARTRDPETFLKVGFFDESWNYDPKYSFGGVADLRAETPPQAFPTQYVGWEDEPVVYLSDVKPTAINQMRGALEFDRSFRGELIRIGGSFYRRGLGVRVPSTVQYNIGDSFETFRGTVGLSTENAQPDSPVRRLRESVKFVVVGDGKTLWESDVIDWKNPAAEVNVSVRGVSVLELRVVPVSPWLWLHGSTAWGDARLTTR